jgi:hypothetical protein
MKFPEFRRSLDLKEAETETQRKAHPEDANADARGRIPGLHEKPTQHPHVIAMLQNKVTQLSTNFEHLVGRVSAL